MTETTRWLSSDGFARLAEISPQAARKALKRSLESCPWRGASLLVRAVARRGGRKGLAYQIDVESLPAEIRPLASPCEVILSSPARMTASKQDAIVSRRWATIAKALDHPARSPQRADAITAAAAKANASTRTVRRWIEDYEGYGIAGLARVRPSNAGHRRVVVSRAFDRAVKQGGHSDAVLGKIGEQVEAALKGLWASRAEVAGWREVRRMAEFLLLEAAEARGLAIPREALRLSRRGVERFAPFRVVNLRRNDRKAFDDAKPRIRRDWTGLDPMERVVGDVKHLDVIVRRPDGSLAWPKIVAFLDAGTGRIFVQPVLLEPGEGVRQEHVIEAFIAMVSAPGWGFPRGLYLDNGAEFAALTKIQGALNAISDAGARTLIFAKPYNASAKPIESAFARLDRYVFSMVSGYAGPNRMAKKTQTVGKPPEPFRGDWEEFCDTLKSLLVVHHDRPVGGLWQDRSPRDWFEQKVASGWRPTTVEPLDLDAAFCDHDSRRVDRGVVKIHGRRFSHPMLAALPGGTVVDLALPWRREADPLARLPSHGWMRLEGDAPTPARWIGGAREADARQRAQGRHVAALAREAPTLDPVAVKRRMAARLETKLAPRPMQALDLGSQARDLSDGLAVEPSKRGPSETEMRRQREMALTERLERRLRTDD